MRETNKFEDLPERFGKPLSIPADSKLVKVPEPLYQIIFEYGYRSWSLERKQTEIMARLVEWIDEVHPGYGIMNFWDFNDQEAQMINERMRDQVAQSVGIEKYNRSRLYISWGMYLLLSPGQEHMKRQTMVGVTHLITEQSQYKLEG